MADEPIETEVAPGAVIDQPAVAANESASPFSDLPFVVSGEPLTSPAEECQIPGGGFDSVFCVPFG